MGICEIRAGRRMVGYGFRGAFVLGLHTCIGMVDRAAFFARLAHVS